MRLPNRYNPGEGVRDFWSVFTRRQPYRWPILGVSMMMTFGLLYWVTQERVVIPPPRPDVTYITTFAEGRSDAEIVASNIENARRQQQLREEIEARAEKRRELYRALGRATGMDVERIEREIAEEQAREREALERQREMMLGERGAAPAP